MKIISQFVAALCLSFHCVASGELDALQAAIAKSCSPGAGVHDDWLAENIKAWPGLRTIDGVAALYDLWMTTGDENVRQACSKIEKELLVPREDIVTYLLERVSSASESSDQMIKLQSLEPYADDIRVIHYLSSLLGDRRVIMGGYLASGYRPRVCDNAITILLRCFENAGVLKRGEGGIVGDTLNQSDFDQNIAALRPYLIQQGVIEARAPYPPKPGRTRPVGGTVTATPPPEGNRLASSGTDVLAEDKASAVTWLWLRWFGILLGAVGLFWLAFGKRRTSNHGE